MLTAALIQTGRTARGASAPPPDHPLSGFVAQPRPEDRVGPFML